MRSKPIFVVSITFATCALLSPRFAFARNPENSPSTDPGVSSVAAQREAARMVPAQAILENEIDARKMQPGQQFRATMSEAVRLKNGPELPRDTVLVGTIATDQMHAGGTSTLALRFSKAELRDGKVVPIEADIMGVAPPPDGGTWGYDEGAASLEPWNGETLRIDERGTLSGIDFHGSIASTNSGVFVSTKKDNMKLQRGSQLSLAIAARGASGGA